MNGADFGGVIRLTDSLGATLSLRGTLNVMPNRSANEAMTNQDGSVDRIMTPAHPQAEITVAAKGVDLVTFFDGPRRNVTIVEASTGRIHLFTAAFMTGRPTVNALNGEVTGIIIAAESYRPVS